MEKKVKDLLTMERCVLIQAVAEAYLLKTTGKKFDEQYPDVKDEYGIINGEQANLLHAYLKEEYKLKGLDLDTCIREAGEEIVDKKISLYEFKELIRIVDDLTGIFYIVDQRKKRLFRK